MAPAPERIRYILHDTRWGRTLLASSALGLWMVAFGDDDASLLHEVIATFPSLHFEPDTAPMAYASALRSVDDPRVPYRGRLDQRGTDLQRAVWEELCRIPLGETRTYSAIAAAVGRPRAARAIGSACGSNRLAVLVPCHRAVGADGSLRGFWWGIERKRAMLEWEAAAANTDLFAARQT